MNTPGIISSPLATPREELLGTVDGRRYLNSWFVSRLIAGILGLAMPALLIAGDLIVLAGGPSTRGSLSAYYHSGMRDIFVGILCVVGIFLVAHRVSEWDRENLLTTVAGLAAIGVALFPTWTDAGQPLTPWQQRLGEPEAAWVHQVCAAAFILSLAVVSLRFRYRDKKHHRATYARVHTICAAAMFASVAILVVGSLAGWQDVGNYTLLLVVEIVCTVAFGVSWLLKGIELRQAILRAEREPDRTPAPVVETPTDAPTAAAATS